MLYGGSPAVYQSEPELKKRVWLELWAEVDAQRTLMQPEPAWTPDGVYSLILRATGSHEKAEEARSQAEAQAKIRQIMRGG